MTVSLPLFYFKPTICWIDDDQLFLAAVNVSFKKNYNCLTFNKPDEAINFFHTYQSPLSAMTFKREFIESDKFGIHDHYPVDIKISNIKNLLNMTDKLHEIAVLVIDYNMPNTNGLEICKQLQSFTMKKILLTGDAGQGKAVEAFNLGLIDKFIEKGHNIADKLQKCVEELIYQYFYERTANLISHIEASRPSLLSDHHFVKFFNIWRIENKIEEFYLINRQGSFLVKDKNGKLAYFVVMSEDDKNEFLKLNDELLEEAGQLLTDVARGKLIPFFGVGKESWDIDVKEWGEYFFSAQVIEGRGRYYWAVVDGED